MFGSFTYSYFAWHYSMAIRDLLSIIGNILVFIVDFFSIVLLTRTLFAPWKRMNETGKVSLLNHPNEYFSQLLVNILMRIVGFFVRLFIILLGISVLFIAFMISILISVVWVLMPICVPLFLVAGIRLLILG